MAHLDVSTEIVLRLTSEEFRLVGLSLARKLKGKDVELARILNTKIQELRLKQLEVIMKIAQDSLESSKKAEVLYAEVVLRDIFDK